MSTEAFFAYARERYAIKLHRDAKSPLHVNGLWTRDPILQQYRFCNIFREDDAVTTWFRENIREPLRDDPSVLLATFAFRAFNKPETWMTYADKAGAGVAWLDLFAHWQEGRRDLEELIREHARAPYTTAAYMVRTPAGMDKIAGVLWVIDQFARKAEDLLAQMTTYQWTIYSSVQALSHFPYMGPFYAYEVATDLRHTYLLERAPDILSWANPGPGAARGLARVLQLPLDNFNRGKPADVEAMNHYMQSLRLAAAREEYWPGEWPEWEMREVEHTLCEFDKYERARLGEGRPKQLFRFSPPKTT